MANGKENNKTNCSICSNRLHGAVGVVGPCGHLMHVKCYQKAQPPEGQTPKCPVCKRRAASFTKLATRLPLVVSTAAGGSSGGGGGPTSPRAAPPTELPLFLEEPAGDYTTVRSPSNGSSLSPRSSSSSSSSPLSPRNGGAAKDDREGCFVFKALKSVTIQRGPSVEAKHQISEDALVRKNELVVVDRVLCHQAGCDNKNGPFLRLADGSGWVFEKRNGDTCMKEMLVEKGLWTFVADNYPNGIALRSGPNDHADTFVEPAVVYYPMQRIVCDRRIRGPDGADFFRVQGTDGWVFDKRGDSFMMIPETSVDKGLFVYRAKTALAIRSDTSIGDSQMTSFSVSQDEMVAVDVIRKSPVRGSTNGPFLRLTDGSGWLFEYKQSELMLERLPVDKGKWAFKVGNDAVHLHRQPIDSPDFFAVPDVQYAPGDFIDCDYKVRSLDGVTFYRVIGTDGWVFDKRANRDLLTKAKPNGKVNRSTTNHSTNGARVPWDPSAVRRIADGIPNLFQIGHSTENEVISFRNNKGVRINVYYATRTIGTAMDHPIGGKTQMFRRHCTTDDLRKMLEHPKAHIGRGYQSSLSKRARLTETGGGQSPAAPTEQEALRTSLQAFEEEIALLNRRRLQVLKDIKETEMMESDESRRYVEKAFALQESANAEGNDGAELNNGGEVVDEEVTAAMLEQQKRGDQIASSIYFSAEIELEGTAKLIALCGEATLMLDEHLEARRTRCLPNDIFWLLQSSEEGDPRPVYVSLGTDDRYFIKFDNGSTQWSEGKCDDFDDIIFADEDVKFVAFGQSWDSYIVVTENDTHWNNVPNQIAKILRGTRPIQSISLGPSGEYFVAWEDGGFKGGGWSNQLNNKLGELKRDGWHVRDIRFGAIDTYVVRYSKYDGPF